MGGTLKWRGIGRFTRIEVADHKLEGGVEHIEACLERMPRLGAVVPDQVVETAAQRHAKKASASVFVPVVLKNVFRDRFNAFFPVAGFLEGFWITHSFLLRRGHPLVGD